MLICIFHQPYHRIRPRFTEDIFPVCFHRPFADEKCNHPDNLLIDGQKITKEKILQVFSQYLGSIEQTPPIFSAVKIAGQRAYKLARAGKVPEMKSRQVFIYSLELVSYDFPELAFRVKCSSGTYVRSLAQDIGQDLDCGGYLTGLRRTMIGDYHISDAVTIEEALKSMED